MDKKDIVNAFYISINRNPTLKKKILDNKAPFTKTEDIILELSSLDFVDLLLEIETHLGITFTDNIIFLDRVTIGEMAERIEKIV